MIYNFDREDSRFREFIALLSEKSLDYEMVKHDKIVVRIFGRVNEELKERLDSISEKAGRLKLKRGTEDHVKTTPGDDGQKLIFAGPCSIESERQIEEIAAFLSSLGITYLRGGAFKPRTQSSSFQGLGRAGLKIMADAAARYGMKIVTELMDRSRLNDVASYADIIQVGSRNMFNYTLLTALGAVDKPILLKRGMAATIDEWIHAADYIRRGGNERIILCERGIRTFEQRTRFTLDILAIPIARELSGLPVMADASHAAGRRDLVPYLLRAALAAGADGVMVEVHPNPAEALSDGKQSMTFPEFEATLHQIREMGLLRTSKSQEKSIFQ